jgi:hypothetical protein
MKCPECKRRNHDNCFFSAQFVMPSRLLEYDLDDDFECDCWCKHEDCECFQCKINSLGFGTVPGGFKDMN